MKYWVGEYIRVYRARQKITQEALGAVAGISQGQMSKIEKCEADPGIHELLVMLKYLGKSITDVVDGCGPARLDL